MILPFLPGIAATATPLVATTSATIATTVAGDGLRGICNIRHPSQKWHVVHST